MKPTKVLPANDTFGVLNAVVDLMQDKHALFVAPFEINGLMPEVHGLADEVANDVALVVDSSGSTGAPKRIELSRSALEASALASAQYLGGHGQWLLTLPVNFIAGLNVLIRSVIADSQPVMMNTQLPFTADGFFRSASLLSGDKRYTSLVPIQLERIYKLVSQDHSLYSLLRRFDAILIGGQRPDGSVIESLRKEGVNLVTSYGMTETSGGCIYNGETLDGVELKLDDQLISIAGPVLANGLGPWFQTNDLGELVDGKLKVTGRADRVIISGGLKVSLELVEDHARRLPGVEDVAAVAFDSEWGQSVAIAYVGTEEASFDSLIRLSEAAKVRATKRLEVLPRLISGKPDLVAIARLFTE